MHFQGFNTLLTLTWVVAVTSHSSLPVPEIVPGAYMVQLHTATTLNRRSDDHTHQHFAKRALERSISYEVRYEYKEADLFYGLSVTLPSNDSLQALQALPEVVSVWPVRLINRPGGVESDPLTSSSLAGLSDSSLSSRSPDSTVIKRQSTALNYNSPHGMTGVDRLHGSGIRGKGVKIAVLDTGVDYRHPALGGCFGSGCKIAFGYDLVGDEYTGYGVPVPDSDPIATCVGGGHGSHVAGIIGMEVPPNSPLFNGLVGVAPDASIGMYRVFGCSGNVGEDVLVSGIGLAAEEGADIISISIGGFAPTGTAPSNPYSALIQGLTNRGIAVVVAAGNSGEAYPFAVEAPGNSPAAIAVASVENTLFQTFELMDSNGDTIRYGSVYPFPSNATLIGIEVGDGSIPGAFGCRAVDFDAVLPRVTGKKDDYVLIAKRGLCSLSLIQSNAANAGFRNVLTYPDTEVLGKRFIAGYAANIPVTDQNNIPLNFGVTTNNRISQGAKKANYTLTFQNQLPQLTRQPFGGKMNNFSSPGPTWDFHLKPQLSAPGGQILSTWPLSGKGWAIVSGTSMATPYLAGCVALLKSQFPSLSVPELLDLLQTTAKPTVRADNYGGGTDQLSSITHQGAGLVNVYDAIFFPSAVSPGQIELQGTETLATAKPEITITNPSKKAVTYTLSHKYVPGMARFPYPDAPPQSAFLNAIFGRLTALNFSATVEFPGGSVITIPAGGSQTVPLKIAGPPNLNPLTIPIYNGYISVVSDRREEFTVPYQGVGYDYAAAPMLGMETPPVQNINDPAYPVLASPQLFDGNRNIVGDYVNVTTLGEVGILTSFLQPARIIRVDLVKAEIDFEPTFYGFNKSNAVSFTRTETPANGTIAGVEILGNIFMIVQEPAYVDLAFFFDYPYIRELETGWWPVPLLRGGYRILVQMLKYGGDETKRTDWSTWMSAVIEAHTDYTCFPGWETCEG